MLATSNELDFETGPRHRRFQGMGFTKACLTEWHDDFTLRRTGRSVRPARLSEFLSVRRHPATVARRVARLHEDLQPGQGPLVLPSFDLVHQLVQ